MSLAILSTLNASVVIPSMADAVAADMLVNDATHALKDKAMDNFKMHLLLCVVAQDPAKHFDSFEAEFKTKSGEKRMPGHYRSNKSVLLSCEKFGIAVVDKDGLPRGKTELEKEIKAHKETPTPFERAKKALEQFQTQYAEVSSLSESMELRNLLATLTTEVLTPSKAA